MRLEVLVRNITLSADERLIDDARECARARRTTLNDEFRRWLIEYTRGPSRAEVGMAVIERIGKYAKTGGLRFSRDELNER